eukprot:CAMPEP_0178494146 /NCGR_PEP_ID=MMETSP0696-20121128/12861_1 /TAXON_ID=265572 /ORGANISM="Extubocellulus spinifer, Strain CCMP396" /LENGTH=113 /DNA_ID=CAMNT_0020122209 /DNA_START=6 /DNA_END=344 /DNA_ORIENTATION=+
MIVPSIIGGTAPPTAAAAPSAPARLKDNLGLVLCSCGCGCDGCRSPPPAPATSYGLNDDADGKDYAGDDADADDAAADWDGSHRDYRHRLRYRSITAVWHRTPSRRRLALLPT